MTLWMIVLIVLIVIAVLTWIGMRVKHPEQTADHSDERPDTISDRYYGTTDRPAGPDAEEPTRPSDPDAGEPTAGEPHRSS